MSDEQTLEELVDEVIALRSGESTLYAKKILSKWHVGIMPSRSEIDKLKKFLRKPGPCARINENGCCQGWLKKHGSAFDLIIPPPYKCPFAPKPGRLTVWNECGGYKEAN